MKITDYGQWTVIENHDGKVKYIPRLESQIFCKRFEQFYKGYKIASVDLANGFWMGAALPTGEVTGITMARPSYEGLDTSIKDPNAVEDFLNVELEKVKNLFAESKKVDDGS